MPTTVRLGITYTEFIDGFKERFAEGDQTATRYCDVAWGDRFLFVTAMLGEADNIGAGVISRFVPEEHPDYFWLHAHEVEFLAGLGTPGIDANGLITYTRARLAVHYRSLPYNIFADDPSHTNELYRWVERRQEFSVENLKVPGGRYTYDSDSKTVAEATTIALPARSLQYVWHQVPDIPEAAIDAGLGKVNSAVFDPAPHGPGLAAGTLLFASASAERQRSATGQEQYTITYNFLYRPNGWNKLYRASTGTFVDVTPDPYGTANLNALFVQP